MQIIELMRREDMQEGAHLTEQWLAEELKVSRSPIRRAMTFLEELGLLSKEKNRGFFLKRAASTLGSTALSSEPDQDETIYLQIAEDRILGKLDDHFSEAEITRRYNLTPRQTQRVLNRMYREDLIQRRQGPRMGIPALARLGRSAREKLRVQDGPRTRRADAADL